MLALSGKTAATTFFFLSFERIAFLAFSETLFWYWEQLNGIILAQDLELLW